MFSRSMHVYSPIAARLIFGRGRYTAWGEDININSITQVFGPGEAAYGSQSSTSIFVVLVTDKYHHPWFEDYLEEIL